MELSEIDLLAQELARDPSEEQYKRLWTGVLNLPHWYFIARKTHPRPEPYFALINEKPWLTAFTSPERLYEFASLQGLVQKGQDIDIFSLNSAAGFAFALHYIRTDIHGIWFDLPGGFYAPLDTLRDIGLYLGMNHGEI